MLRLAVLVLGSALVAACGGAPAATSPPTAAPSPVAPTPAPTPATTPAPSTPAASLPPGVVEGGSGWGASASNLDLGDRARFTCPPNGDEYAIWGTGIYTSDSSVCTAGVHAGLISFASGGDVIIDVGGSQESYAGTTQNGVTSREYGTYSSSFTIVGAAPPASGGPPPPSSALTGDAAELLAHVPAAIQGECVEVTSFDAGVIVIIQCINIPDVDGYVSYTRFDNDTNQFASFTSNFEFYGDPEGGSDCAAGPSLVAHDREGFVEGRLFCNAAPQLDPDALIYEWFDTGLLISATMVAYGYSYADAYDLYLTAGPTE